MNLTYRDDSDIKKLSSKDRNNIAVKKYRIKNKEIVKARYKKWEENNKDKLKEWRKRYYEENKDIFKKKLLDRVKKIGGWSEYYKKYYKEKQCTGRPYGKHITPLLGKNNPNWKGGITTEDLKIRTSIEYKLWRKAVFARDNWTCQYCGDNTGHNLNAHHLKTFKDCHELRTSINNGITLCKNCHIEIHKKEDK